MTDTSTDSDMARNHPGLHGHTIRVQEVEAYRVQSLFTHFVAISASIKTRI